MRAMIFNEFGPPDVLHYEELPDPVAGPGDLVIEVHAVSVNRVLDVAVRAGTVPVYGVKPPHVPGVDPSGVVVSVGEGVTDFAPGDRVAVMMAMPDGGRFGLTCNGGDAEYTRVPAACCVKVRQDVDFPEATVIARHGPVAYNLLFNLGKLKEGETVLILGADHAINYNAVDLTEAVMEITGGKGADLFYDNIANPKVCPLGIESLGRGGRMVTAGAHGGPVVPVNFHTVYNRRLTIMGSPDSDPVNALPCFDAAAEGRLKVIVDRVVPLSEAPAMHALIERDPGVGKVILDPTQG